MTIDHQVLLCGRTIVLMDRGLALLHDLSGIYGEKEKELFKSAIQTLSEVIKQTEDISLLTDGEL